MSSENGQRAGQAVFLIVGQVMAALSDTIAPILLVRLLSPTQVGILSGVMLLYGVIAPVFASAFPATLMYFLPPRGPAQRRAIAARVASILFVSGLLVAAFFLAIGLVASFAPVGVLSLASRVQGVSALGPEGLMYLVVLCPLPIGDLPSRMLQNLLIIEGRAKAAAWQGVIKAVGNAAATVIPVLLGANLWWVVGSVAAFGLLYGLCVPIYLRVLYGSSGVERSQIGLRQLFRFSIPLGLTDTVMVLYNRIDQFLIAVAFPAAVLAYYRMGAWQIPVVTTIATAVGAVFSPHLTRLFSEGAGAEAVRIWRQSIQKVSLITVPIGLAFIVIADDFIELMFTSEYAPAVNIFRCYCLLTIGRVATFGNVLVAAGKPGLTTRAAIVSLAANIAFSVPLMIIFGFEGPALGSVLAFVCTVAMYCFFIGRAAGLTFSRVFPLTSFLKTLALGIAAAVPASLVTQLDISPHWVRMLCAAAVVIVGFSILGTLTGLIGREDWRFLKAAATGRLAVAEMPSAER